MAWTHHWKRSPAALRWTILTVFILSNIDTAINLELLIEVFYFNSGKTLLFYGTNGVWQSVWREVNYVLITLIADGFMVCTFRRMTFYLTVDLSHLETVVLKVDIHHHSDFTTSSRSGIWIHLICKGIVWSDANSSPIRDHLSYHQLRMSSHDCNIDLCKTSQASSGNRLA